MHLHTTIQQHLVPHSDIRIGSTGGLFVATYSLHHKEKAKAISDKGIDHLLLLLEGKILYKDDEVYKKRADELYVYSPGPMSEGRELETIFEKCVTKIFPVGPWYTVNCRRVQIPDIHAVPTIYELHRFSSSLEKVFEDIVDDPTFKSEEERFSVSKQDIKEFFHL